MMCVNDAFDWPISARWLLMTRRFSSRTLTGMLRTEVAVGTVSDDSMFATIFDAAPRRATGVAGGGRSGGDGRRDGGAAGARRGAAGAGRRGGATAPPRDRGDALLDLLLDVLFFVGRRVVVLEELAPARAHRLRIGAVLLVQLFDEGDVGAVRLMTDDMSVVPERSAQSSVARSRFDGRVRQRRQAEPAEAGGESAEDVGGEVYAEVHA